MNSLNYYKANNEQATREEMFVYIETLMIQRAYADALDVFADLKRIELGDKVSSAKKLVLDEKKTPIAQMKGLLNNPLAWRMVQRHGSKSATKVPTDEAIEVFRSIKLTHENLFSQLRANTPGYQKALLATHKAWDTNWVVSHFNDDRRTYYGGHHDVALSILHSSPKMDAVIRVAEMMKKKDEHTRRAFFGDGSNLDDTTLFKLVDMGYASVLADSRISGEVIQNYWDEHFATPKASHNRTYSDPRYEFYAAISKNFNTPAWLMDNAVEFTGGWSIDSAMLTHPNLTAESLNTLLGKTKDKEHRLLIARHPNVSMAILKKLSKSAYQPLAETATEKLAEKEAERKKSLRRGY